MIRILIISCIAILTLSQCDDGKNAGAPKNKVVKVERPKKSEATPKAKKSTSSMDGDQVAKAKQIIASVKDGAVQAVNAKKIFKANCASCHGFTGNLGINGAKDLTASNISLEEAIAQVYHGKGLMTPYKDILSAEELVAVAKYTETLRK